MSCSKTSSADLRQKLSEQFNEEAPAKWSRAQLLLRLVELGGPSVLESTPKGHSPLRQIEVEINKSARKKVHLQTYLTQQLGMSLTGNETVDQLRTKGMSHAYEITPGHPTDFVGFGTHAGKTYLEMTMDYADYLNWVVKTSQEGDASPKLKRLARWVTSSEGQEFMEMTGNAKKPGSAKKTFNQKGDKKAATSSDPESQTMVEMMAKMKAMEAELKELKSQKSRKTRTGEEELTSSDWDAMSSVANTQ